MTVCRPCAGVEKDWFKDPVVRKNAVEDPNPNNGCEGSMCAYPGNCGMMEALAVLQLNTHKSAKSRACVLPTLGSVLYAHDLNVRATTFCFQ